MSENVERLLIKLTVDQKKKLNSWITQEKDQIDIARSPFYDRHQRYLYNFDDYITFQRQGPWDGSSNLHMPLTGIMVKTYHARFYNIFANESTTILSAREGFDKEMAKALRDLFQWYMWDYLNGYEGIRSFTREMFYDVVTVGFGIGFKDWYVKSRKIREIVKNEVNQNELQREMKDLGKRIRSTRKKRPMLETGEEMDKFSVSMKPYKEAQKIVEVFKGSRLRTVPFENAYFPNDIPGSDNMDHPRLVVLETEMSVSEVLRKGESGEWDKKACEEIVNEGSKDYNWRRQDIKRQRERLSGYNSDMIHDKTPRTIQYCFATYDIDDDRFDEEVVVVRSSRGKIASVVYLDNITRSGSRPVFKFSCFSKPRQAYARGVPEFMYPLNEEMDMTHNMKNDYLALQTCPFGVYRGNSSLKAQPIRIAPGKFIPVEETSDMRVLNFQTNAVSLGSEEDRLWKYAERLASSSSLDQGIVPDAVGPTRSTSGVVTMLRQMDKEFKLVVDQCSMQWRKMVAMIIEDLDYKVDLNLKMKVLGASVDAMIDRAYARDPQIEIIHDAVRVNGQLDIRINVADAIRSDEVFRSEATQVLQMLTAPGLAAQLGIIGPKALFKAYDDWLTAYGKDADEYLDEPEFLGKALTLYQEIQICAQQQMPPMAMKDDHMQKAQMLIAWIQDPEYIQAKQLGVYAPDTDAWLMKASQKHATLAEMLRPKGLPNPTGENQQDFSQAAAGQSHQQRPQVQRQEQLPPPPAERQAEQNNPPVQR